MSGILYSAASLLRISSSLSLSYSFKSTISPKVVAITDICEEFTVEGIFDFKDVISEPIVTKSTVIS